MHNTIYYSKFKATAIHFSISLAIFSLFIFILRYFWYPEPYFSASGGWQGLKIVLLIDLVLGPLLTFIIYSPLKELKELRKDLSIIASLQLLALFVGIYTVYNQRPVAITFWEHSFYTVPFKALDDSYSNSNELVKILEQPRQLYYVEKPTTYNGILQINNESQDKQLPPFQLINHYKNFNDYFNQLKIHSINIKQKYASNKSILTEYKLLLDQTQTNEEDNIYLPLTSKYQNIIIAFTHDGQLLGYINAPFNATLNE